MLLAIGLFVTGRITRRKAALAAASIRAMGPAFSPVVAAFR